MSNSRGFITPTFSLVLLLAACGGGGPGTPAPPVAPTPTAAGHASPTPQPSATVTSSAGPASTAVDCTAADDACPTIAIAGDPPSNDEFHGYADPSMRNDPASGVQELAYSWPRALADGSRVVDLHLAHSSDGGSTWTYDGALWSSARFANPGGGSYAATDDTSTETVNLLPIAGNGSTTWVQAHWAYLVAAGSTAIYGQTGSASYISVSALAVPQGSQPSALLGLTNAPEARLGNAGTDPTLHATTNLSTLAPPYSSCDTFQQPAMAYVGGTLYLAVQCSDGGPPAFAVFSTTPAGSNATAWTWRYNGEIATAAQAAALAAREGLPYTFFTELDFAVSKAGSLLAVLSGAQDVSGGVQPYSQYGCRLIAVTSLATPALAVDSSGVPIVTAKVTASDLYTGANEGPGACTYDASSKTGVVIVHKLENDPSLGFYVTLEASGIAP